MQEEQEEGQEEIRRRVDHLGVLNSSVVLVFILEEGVAVAGLEAVVGLIVMEVVVVDPRT